MVSSRHTYVALLRGINVGGNSPVSMAELKLCLEELGHSDVKTFINSGNVIFKTRSTNQRALETEIEETLDARFSQPIRVMVRSFEEMQRLIRSIPKNWLTSSDQRCNVIFLHHSIDSPEILENFQPKPGIEELHYHPGVLFWSAKSSDLTKSGMLKVNRMPIYQFMTVRGLNTTQKLYDLMSEASQS
jgi:uncharacterized protein (DUF1697 family)